MGRMSYAEMCKVDLKGPDKLVEIGWKRYWVLQIFAFHSARSPQSSGSKYSRLPLPARLLARGFLSRPAYAQAIHPLALPFSHDANIPPRSLSYPSSTVPLPQLRLRKMHLYRAGVEHDADHGAERLGREVVLELCADDTRVA